MIATTNNLLPWQVGEKLPLELFRTIRTRLILDHCKWDPQVGDSSSLAPFPILLSSHLWKYFSQKARLLSAELIAAEKEICSRPELLQTLGMPGTIRKLIASTKATPPSTSPRVMRFDFHYTTEGWKISEVNNDVPGGFTESASFPELFQQHFPQAHLCGNPVTTLVRHISEQVTGGTVLLFAAPGYMEDQQVVAFLAKRLRAAGIPSLVATPKQLQWSNGRLTIPASDARIDCVLRFFQAEWLPRLGSGWKNFFLHSAITILNPAITIIGESKRFPLLWSELHSSLPTWRELLPETRDPREVPWSGDDQWVLKTAYSNNGDSVTIQSDLSPAARRKLNWQLLLFPGSWIAQKRFQPVWFDTPLGLAQLCIGVYVIDGELAGAYGRLTSKRIVDYSAVDVPILISPAYDQT